MTLSRNIIIVLIALGLTLPKDVFIQIRKIPGLVEHYHHHSTEHGDISFLSFLALHFTDDLHHDDQNHEHENLPCHHHHGTECASTITAGFITGENKISFAFLNEKQKEHLPLTENFSSFYFQNIWQPPKIG